MHLRSCPCHNYIYEYIDLLIAGCHFIVYADYRKRSRFRNKRQRERKRGGENNESKQDRNAELLNMAAITEVVTLANFEAKMPNWTPDLPNHLYALVDMGRFVILTACCAIASIVRILAIDGG